MKFQIMLMKRKRLGSFHLLPLKVLVRFENGQEKWFDTYDFGKGLFWYRLFENIKAFLRFDEVDGTKIFSTTYETDDKYAYQKYEEEIGDEEGFNQWVWNA